jgi:hypothetical protein
MRCPRIAIAALAALMLAMPAAAEDRHHRDPFARLDPQVLFRDLVREGDVTLLFDYLRYALAAAARGEEPPPPEELRRRAQALGDELRLRGALAALGLLNALEAEVKERLREPPPRRAPPPAPPAFPYRQ